MRRSWVLLLLPACAILIALALLPPFPQPQEYHRFADARAWAGVPNFGDVASNLGFLVVAVAGFVAIRRDAASPLERVPYGLFFASLAATAFGSAWYHLAPDDARLFWDRLPIALCFAALLSAVIGERLSTRVGILMLAPLAFAGAGAVWSWRQSETAGAGNVLPYFAFQLYALLATLLLMHGRPSRYSRGEDFYRVMMLYGAAIAAELFDRPIFALGEMVSGHTLKHLLAGLGAYQVVRMLRLRRHT